MWNGICPTTQGFNQNDRLVSRFFYCVTPVHNRLGNQNRRAFEEYANELARRMRGWALNFALFGRREHETAIVDRRRYRWRDGGCYPVIELRRARRGDTVEPVTILCAVTLLWGNSRESAREFPTTN